MIERRENDGVFRLRASAAPAGSYYVTFNPTAFALGYAVACLLLGIIATAVIGWGTSRDVWGYAWTVVVVAFYAAGLGLFTALPVALALGFVLRTVRSQWLHLLAFFLVPTAVAWLVIGLVVRSVTVPLLMALAIGVCAAAGRAAVWRLMKVRVAPPAA